MKKTILSFYLADPNNNCYRGTDINGDGPVDINDMTLFVDEWLLGIQL